MARPRKNVLMYCANDAEASVRRFVIEQQTRNQKDGGMYRIHAASTSDAVTRALSLHPDAYFSCVLIFGTGDPAAPQLAADLEKAVPVLYVECVRERDKPTDWLPKLKIACAVKRGPKPARYTLRSQESTA